MKRLRTWLSGLIGLLVFSSCGLFGPEKPYNQGDRRDPLILDQPHPEKPPANSSESPSFIDYLFPWRLLGDGE